MENRDMIRMANQIAAFFEAYPRTEALDGIAKHIKSFWDPRMRKQLSAYIEPNLESRVVQVDGGGEGLSPLVIAALALKAKTKT
jgi:formate dehydrogenase subunit delta